MAVTPTGGGGSGSGGGPAAARGSSSSSSAAAANNKTNLLTTDDLPPPQGTRYIVPAEEELRMEVSFVKSSVCQIVLQKGSCELLGVELAHRKVYRLEGGGLTLALYTYHGCVIDVDCPEGHEHTYISDETPNLAYVNTHAQLEALRDEAAAAAAAAAAATTTTTAATANNSSAPSSSSSLLQPSEGPRVLVCGPSESGKSSLVQTLVAYATKLGRTPLWVDLDPANNHLSVPGTLAVCPMNRESLTLPSQALGGGIPPGTASPLTLWHGSIQPSRDLFEAQVSALGQKIDARLQHDDWERSSGILVNTNGWIADDGYQMLLHTIQALRISVILILGHDKLYHTLHTTFPNRKVIKLPRSGGVIARDSVFLRQVRSRSIKRYFYGDMVDALALTTAGGGGGGGGASSHNSNTATTLTATTGTTTPRVPQLTPFLVQLPFRQITIYKFTSLSLSASLLPVAATQTTEAVQLITESISEQLAHRVLAVCHPHAVATYTATGHASDLYACGVAGFVAVERVGMDTEILHLLSPCAGALPSHTLLVGDITWMD